MNLAIPLLVLMLSHGASKATPATKARTPFKGKSGRTWFVVDSIAGASKTPIRDVFAEATGNLHVLTFALLPGGIRARMFVSPSTLTAIALSDFDVSPASAGKL